MQDKSTFELLMPHPKGGERPDYNSTRERLKLPEYGRFVQEMVEYLKTIEDKTERQRYAEAIIAIMADVNLKLKDEPDFKHKLWDHLAYISNYSLDIDYPCEIHHINEKHQAPNRLAYPKGTIKMRHYGALIEKALTELAQMPEGAPRDRMTRLIANRMKCNLADWKGDGIQDTKVARDIAFYTEGKVTPDFESPGQQLQQFGENKFRSRKNKA